jgi:hypothetical protein
MPIRESSAHDTNDREDPYAYMPSCDDCGVLFETVHDLQRHVKRWCPKRDRESLKRHRENDDEDDTEDDVYRTAKKPKIEKERKQNERKVYDALVVLSQKANGPAFQSINTKYVEEKGTDAGKARVKAEDKLWDSDLNIYLNKYAVLIDQYTNFEHGPLHKRIMNTMITHQMDTANPNLLEWRCRRTSTNWGRFSTRILTQRRLNNRKTKAKMKLKMKTTTKTVLTRVKKRVMSQKLKRLTSQKTQIPKCVSACSRACMCVHAHACVCVRVRVRVCVRVCVCVVGKTKHTNFDVDSINISQVQDDTRYIELCCFIGVIIFLLLLMLNS